MLLQAANTDELEQALRTRLRVKPGGMRDKVLTEYVPKTVESLKQRELKLGNFKELTPNELTTATYLDVKTIEEGRTGGVILTFVLQSFLKVAICLIVEWWLERQSSSTH